jgi:hypothetical protein
VGISRVICSIIEYPSRISMRSQRFKRCSSRSIPKRVTGGITPERKRLRNWPGEWLGGSRELSKRELVLF